MALNHERRRTENGLTMLGRLLAAAVSLALAAAGCSGGTPPLAVEEYAAALQGVESGFESEAPNPLDRVEDRDQYPLGGDLVVANDLYMEFHNRLVGWRAITPPTEMHELHVRLVEALDAVQEEVGRYLGEQAMSEADFRFDSIGPAVGPLLRDATQACMELRSALLDAGAEVEFANACSF